MAGIPHDHYEPKPGFQTWLHNRLPIVSIAYDTLMIPTPKNLNWMWIWGIVLAFCLGLQIVTGVVLVMHYTPHVDLAFKSVEHIMRDVNGGYMIRYLHANGASLFFLAVYLHIFRGLYYGSYKAPREVTWIIGMLIYLAMMATGFMGYVLPWGQMSFWGATVITGLFGAIPGVGPTIQEWLLGGPAVDNATLNRFFSLHYLLPFVIAALVALHIWAFHTTGNNNPTGVEVRRGSKEEAAKDTLPFWPYFVIKDLFALAVVVMVFFAVVGFMPNFLGHPDNYIEANALATPSMPTLAVTIASPVLGAAAAKPLQIGLMRRDELESGVEVVDGEGRRMMDESRVWLFEHLANRGLRIIGKHREGTINCLVFRDVDLGEPLAVHVLKQVVLWADVRVEFVGVDAWLHAHSYILNRSSDNRPSRLQTA